MQIYIVARHIATSTQKGRQHASMKCRTIHRVTAKAGNRKQEWEFVQNAAWAETTQNSCSEIEPGTIWYSW